MHEAASGADLELAHHLADLAAEIALRHLAADRLAVRVKDDGSPVTDADHEIEHALRACILREYPDDGFLGEESGGVGPSRRRWIIDGIDGTAGFVAGEPEWSTLIALEEEGEVTLGMVGAPALGRRWWAAPGHGSWTAPYPFDSTTPAQRLSIAPGGGLHQASLGIWPPAPRLSASQRAVAARLAAHVTRTRPVLDWTSAEPAAAAPAKPSAGSGTCHGALLVATGQLDAFLLMAAGAWDIAALVPIVQEAGGIVSDLGGRSGVDPGAVLFARRGLHQRILEVAASGS